MSYGIMVASRAVEKQLAAVSEGDRGHVLTRNRILAGQPRPKGVKLLARDVSRLRIGRHRVVYKILEKEGVILIVKATLRTDRPRMVLRGCSSIFARGGAQLANPRETAGSVIPSIKRKRREREDLHPPGFPIFPSAS